MSISPNMLEVFGTPKPTPNNQHLNNTYNQHLNQHLKQHLNLQLSEKALFKDKETFSDRRETKGYKEPTPTPDVGKKLEVSELDKALSNFTPEQLVELNKSGDLNIGKGALNDLLKLLENKIDPDKDRMIGDLRRIEEEDWGTSEADDKGLIYKTYKDKGGGILKIGNLSGHRYEDSAYKDIKIIDYDATIANYDPQESL